MFDFLTLKRLGFVVGHAILAALIAHLVMWTGGSFVSGCIAGLAVLVVGEAKERIGRLKEAGTFKNTVLNNLRAFARSQDSPWELFQTFGAIAMYALFMGVLHLLGIQTF